MPPSLADGKRQAEDTGGARPKRQRSIEHDPLLDRLLLDMEGWRPPPQLRDADDERHVKLSEYLKSHGLRTALVTSPHLAVSVILSNDVQGAAAPEPGSEGPWLMLGLHPQQEALEEVYAEAYRHRVQGLAFVRALRRCLPSAAGEGPLQATLAEAEGHFLTCKGRGEADAAVTRLIDRACAAAPGEARRDVLEKEATRLRWRHCSLANALLQHFLEVSGLALADVTFRPSAGLSRLTLTMWEPCLSAKRPAHFSFMPGLATALVGRFWAALWGFGYFPSAAFKAPVSEQLSAYFRSALLKHGRMSVAAGFAPAHHFALYLEGKAGAGKSSFVSKMVPALASTVEELLDPEMDVRFVKQNLNKTLGELEQELTLRPNNNDLSVMSIIQGRRMTLSQTKPGLVVVALEEVPPAAEGRGAQAEEDADEEGAHDPSAIEQHATLRLLSRRFQGLRGKGVTASELSRLRQQGRAGISEHPEVLTIFTSNYPLSHPAGANLQPLPMFSNLLQLPVAAIATHERRAFAEGYLAQMLGVRVQLDFDLGEGDIMDLVRYLRTLAFHAAPALEAVGGAGELAVLVRQREGDCGMRVLHAHVGEGEGAISLVRLRVGGHGNLFPMDTPPAHPRAHSVAEHVRRRMAGLCLDDIGHVVEYWYSGVLMPAVVVVRSALLASALVEALAQDPAVSAIRGIDATTYRIVKSLYEGHEVRSLRDDIKALRRLSSEALVVTEVSCHTTDAQLKIRELLEDTPSMVAFSTAKSALQKRGLFFVVDVGSITITPEIRSRASLVIDEVPLKQ
jgi:hypothetical protein